MIKAFFYDTLCGMVYRCMFAGLDEYGHAQWVSITPGEESKTLDDVVVDEDLGDTRFILTDIDEFDDLHELFLWIRTYLFALELTAEIPIITKDLRISDELRQKVKKNDLAMFSSIMKEYDFLENKEEN